MESPKELSAHPVEKFRILKVAQRPETMVVELVTKTGSAFFLLNRPSAEELGRVLTEKAAQLPMPQKH